MTCPICNRVKCDHTPTERGQTVEEVLADRRADRIPARSTPHTKKPPAHEAILDRIEAAEGELLGLVPHDPIELKRANNTEAQAALLETIREHRAVALALLNVLNHMYLPESARPKILRRLQALDTKVLCGTIEPYVQLLVELSRDELDPTTSLPELPPHIIDMTDWLSPISTYGDRAIFDRRLAEGFALCAFGHGPWDKEDLHRIVGVWAFAHPDGRIATLENPKQRDPTTMMTMRAGRDENIYTEASFSNWLKEWRITMSEWMPLAYVCFKFPGR